ncbi:EpsG family protein [Bacillus pacificus]|uniref:EpsG family protein n=1 Tax=Bacillus pacificus TaxID=2026187 RepID=UPI003D22B702
MNVLIMNLGIVFFFGFFSRYFAKPAITGPLDIRPNRLVLLFSIISLVLVSGLRKNIGDTSFYMHSYAITNFNWEYVKKSEDVGFVLYQMLLKSYTDDPQVLIFVTAAITNILIVVVLCRYSRYIEISLYVYITSGMYLVSMNGIRQFLTAALVFTATKYIFDGNWKKYVLVVLIASLFHQSALILIPIYFLIRRKAWTGTSFLLLFLSICVVLLFQEFSEFLFAAIKDTQYEHYKGFSEGGANFLRVVVTGVPLILAYMGRDKLRELFPESDYIVNMSLLGLFFMIISTQSWIFARFTIYFGLYQLLLISWIIKLFAMNNQRFIYYSILVCYFLYFIYEHVVTLNIIYKSDFF